MTTYGLLMSVFNEPEYLSLVIEPIAHQFQQITFIMNETPWHGHSIDNSATLKKIEELCQKYKQCQFIRSSWVTEADQRNHALDLQKQNNITYTFIIDSDEVYSNEHIQNIKNFMQRFPNAIAFHIEMDTFWTKNFYVIRPRENYSPLAVVKPDQFIFDYIRAGYTGKEADGTVHGPGHPAYRGLKIPADQAVCFHLSYARTDAFVKSKVSSFSEADDILSGWYENVWLKWKPENQNLHPINPPQYQKAEPCDLETLPLHLKEYILQNRIS